MATAKKTTAKTATVVAPVVTSKVEVVTLGNCTYHYWRNWLKDVLKEAGVISAKFKKEAGTYNGTVSVAKSEKQKAEAAVKKYEKDNDCVSLVWK